MAAQSSIEIEIHSPTSCIVTLHGEHDMASREAVTMALALTRDYTRVLVDLTTCTFIDATVTNALLAAAARPQDGRSLELIVPSGAHPVRRLLSIAGILTGLRLHPTRAHGLATVETTERQSAPLRARDLRVVPGSVAKRANGAAAQRWKRPAGARRGVTVLRAHVTDDAELTDTSAHGAPGKARGDIHPGSPESWGQQAA